MGSYDGVFPHSNVRNDRGMGPYPGIPFQDYRPVFVVDGLKRINRAVGSYLDIILNDNAMSGIDIRECTDVGAVPKFQVILVLDQPVVFCQDPFFNRRKNPLFESHGIDTNFFFVVIKTSLGETDFIINGFLRGIKP